MSFSLSDVKGWDTESVFGWLKVVGCADCVDLFQEHDVNGEVLLLLTNDSLTEIGIPADKAALILKGITNIKANAGSNVPAPVLEESSDDEGSSPTKGGAKKPGGSVDKKNDPLRIAASGKAVADLNKCAVSSGFLWKVGGSGMFKAKHWKRRYFVLTDDNCIYYFKSPKDLAALGMILLPSYTITITSKSENPGNRPFAFKAFNREHSDARTYIFAAESMEEMKVWMNLMSLASIAFGSGKASRMKVDTSVRDLSNDADPEFKLMQQRASDRAGGVTGDAQAGPIKEASTKLPGFIRETLKSKKGGPQLCTVAMLDGSTMQLYAEPGTLGQNFLDQVCSILKCEEKYYFGLSFVDHKGDEDFLALDKKVLKHDFQRSNDDVVQLQFRVQFYPMDVTQVLQYATLVAIFQQAQRDILQGKLEVSTKDAHLMSALALQATAGDFNPAVHVYEKYKNDHFIPKRNKADRTNQQVIEETFRVWKTLQGILKHLAVLKFCQTVQKHKNFAMQFFEVKNKKGTPLNMGLHPHGVNVYRLGQKHSPICKFSWAECSELSFSEKKFSIQVHDREVKPFSVYCNRVHTCLQVLNQCVGLHRLYVQTVRLWNEAPPDLKEARARAVKVAMQERDVLKAETSAVRRKAADLRAKLAPSQKQAPPQAKPVSQPVSAAPLSPPPQSPAPVSAPPPKAASADEDDGLSPAMYKILQKAAQKKDAPVANKDQALNLIDNMMADKDFMELQDELLAQMELELGEGYGDMDEEESQEEEEPEEQQVRYRCTSVSVKDRVEHVNDLDQVR